MRKFKLLRMDIEGGEIEVLKSIMENIDDISISNILFENHPVQYEKTNYDRVIKKLYKK